MPVQSFQRNASRRRSRRHAAFDPRRVLALLLALSLAALGALPRVAEALSGAVAPSFAESLRTNGKASCRVVEVVDGDTVTLACPGRPAERARLTGFDTPELFSSRCPGERASATQAKRHLGGLIRGSDRLGVVRQGQDRYGRTLVAMSVDGRPVAREMIDAGLARAYDGGRRGGWCGAEPRVTAAGGTTEEWLEVGGRRPSERGTSAR